LLDTGKYGFTEQDNETFPESRSYLAIGATKTTHIVEGMTGKASAAVMIGGCFSSFHQLKNYSYMYVSFSVKKTPFHEADHPLAVKIQALAGNERYPLSERAVKKVNDNIKGSRSFVLYLSSFIIYLGLWVYIHHETSKDGTPKPRREFPIHGMVSTTASQQSFDMVVDEAGNVRKTTVAQHFSQRYGIELTYVIHLKKRFNDPNRFSTY
jgi:hypothetical protein